LSSEAADKAQISGDVSDNAEVESVESETEVDGQRAKKGTSGEYLEKQEPIL
jgi:hypothetical protein